MGYIKRLIKKFEDRTLFDHPMPDGVNPKSPYALPEDEMPKFCMKHDVDVYPFYSEVKKETVWFHKVLETGETCYIK